MPTGMSVVPFLSLLAARVCLFLLVASCVATAKPVALFTRGGPKAGAILPSNAINPDAILTVRVASDVLESDPASVILDLPSGYSIVATAAARPNAIGKLKKKKKFSVDTVDLPSWVGDTENSTLSDSFTGLFVSDDGSMYGYIRVVDSNTKRTRAFAVEPMLLPGKKTGQRDKDPTGLHLVYETFEVDANNRKGVVAPVQVDAASTNPSNADNTATSSAVAGGGAGRRLRQNLTPRLDLLLLYTQSAVSAAGSLATLQYRLRLAVSMANKAYWESGLNVYLNIVGMRAITSITTAVDLNALLGQAQSNLIPGIDIAALRTSTGADMVSVFAVGLSGGAAGWGYFPNRNSDPVTFAPWAYSVVDHSAWNGYTLAHELGHNLGCGHNYDGNNPASTAVATDSLSSYAFGYRRCDLGSAGNFKSIMSYWCSSKFPGVPNEVEVGRFSNVLTGWQGSYSNLPFGSSTTANCVGQIQQTASVVASYKAQTTSAVVGSLLSLYYYLETNALANYCVDVPWEAGWGTSSPVPSLTNGYQLQIWNCNGQVNQQFILLSDSSVRLMDFNGNPLNKCLDFPTETGGAAGAKVQFWDCNGQIQQKWFMDSLLGVRNLYNPTLCMELVTSPPTNGVKMVMKACTNNGAQQYKGLFTVFKPNSNQLKNRLANMCLDVVGTTATGGAGSALQMKVCAANPPAVSSQRWTMDTSSRLKVTTSLGTFCLEVVTSTFATRLAACSTGLNQRWAYDAMGRLRSFASPWKCFDIQYENANDGAPLFTYDCNAGAGMQWYV